MSDGVNCRIKANDKLPYEYFNRFSLCVLDVVRKLQQISKFGKGVEKGHIIEYLRKQPYIDGDLTSQVSIALRQLENCGYLMRLKNGYKTLGPFAKLCLGKTRKERHLAWRNLELKFRHCNSDSTRTSHSAPGSESDSCNNGSCSTVNTQDIEGYSN